MRTALQWAAAAVVTLLVSPVTGADEIVKAVPPKSGSFGTAGECQRGELVFKEQCVPMDLLFRPKAVEVCIKPTATGGLPPLETWSMGDVDGTWSMGDCTVYTAQDVQKALTEEVQKMQEYGSFSNCDTYYNDSGGSITVCP